MLFLNKNLKREKKIELAVILILLTKHASLNFYNCLNVWLNITML